MKFTDGYWMMRPGVTPHYPAQAYETECGDGEIVLCAPTRRITQRGDTVSQPLLTVRFSAPLPGAIRCEVHHLRSLVDMGVDCFKTDFGERIPTDVVYADGSDPERMHNYYALLYNRTVFEALEGKTGSGQATLFARSATMGGQQYPVHWGGDCTASFESMAESLRGGLSPTLKGSRPWR